MRWFNNLFNFPIKTNRRIISLEEQRAKLNSNTVQHIILSTRHYKDGYYEVIMAIKAKENKLKISVEEYIPHPSLQGIGGPNENLEEVDSDSPDYTKYNKHSKYLYDSKVVEKFYATNTQIKGSW